MGVIIKHVPFSSSSVRLPSLEGADNSDVLRSKGAASWGHDKRDRPIILTSLIWARKALSFEIFIFF
jgi:hypothetical protein